MNLDRTKEVPIGECAYQVRRLTPAVAGYVWQRLMAACYAVERRTAPVGDAPAAPAQGASSAPASDAPTDEERLRGLCGIAFMGLDYADYSFVQAACMKVASRVEPSGPMPLMADDGRWAAGTLDVQEDPMLISRLMVEVLVFNLIPFLRAI